MKIAKLDCMIFPCVDLLEAIRLRKLSGSLMLSQWIEKYCDECNHKMQSEKHEYELKRAKEG